MTDRMAGDPASTGATSPRVVTVVLNWNGGNDTLECLRSLQDLDYPNHGVVVVDNASRDGSPAAIRRAHPHPVLLENQVNLGYTGGNNIGIRRALEEGADYVWLLNNDTRVDPQAVRRLVDAARRRPQVGLLSPEIRSHERPSEVQFAGAWLDRERRSIELARDAARGGPLVLWGTALMIRREVIEEVGLLDERYFAYHEDLDYCLRALSQGYLTWVEPGAIVYHKGGASFGRRESATRSYFFTRNRYLLWLDRLSAGELRRERRLFLADAIGDAAYWKARGKLDTARACLDGAWSAIRGRFGARADDDRMPRVIQSLLLAHPYLATALLNGNRLALLDLLRARARRHLALSGWADWVSGRGR